MQDEITGTLTIAIHVHLNRERGKFVTVHRHYGLTEQMATDEAKQFMKLNPSLRPHVAKVTWQPESKDLLVGNL